MHATGPHQRRFTYNAVLGTIAFRPDHDVPLWISQMLASMGKICILLHLQCRLSQILKKNTKKNIKMTVWIVPNLYQVDLTTYILTITNAITRYKIFISCRCDASVEISEKDKIVIVKKSPNWHCNGNIHQ